MILKAVAKVRSRKEWADIINSDWRKSIDSIIQTGRDLAAAKDDLAHGEFEKMIDGDLAFSTRTARSLMRIAEHPAIGKSATSSVLPPSWAVLAELTKLSERDFERAEKKGLITPNTTARQARVIAEAYDDELPSDKPIGEGRSRQMLPSPEEATDLAAKTGRLVAANDGRIYTGASEEEGADFVRRRQQTYGVVDAINAIADCPVSAAKWAKEAESYMLHSFRLNSIDAAIKWLTELRPVLAKKSGVVDAE